MSDTRTQLKHIATEQIRRATLNAASFREMGKAADIKCSSVHYHFDNRDALLLELMTDYEQNFFRQLDERCLDMTSPSKRLQILVQLFLESHSQQFQCLSLAFAAAGPDTTTEQQLVVEQFIQRLEQWVIDSLARAHLLVMPKPELARLVISALQGAVLLDRQQQHPGRLIAVSAWLKTITRL